MRDDAIIELYFSRSEQAISETKSKYGALCEAIARGILGSPQDAEEAVSSAYLKLWNAIPPNRPQSLCGYLCSIVRNTALTAYSRIKRRSCEELFDELEEAVPDIASVERKFESRQIIKYINEFLGRQPKKSRDIFVARYYFNLSVREIAGSAGMTETAVKTRLSRTRSALRSFLEGKEVDL